METVQSVLASVAIVLLLLDRLWWSKRYREAKAVEIQALKTRNETLEAISSKEFLHYMVEQKKQLLGLLEETKDNYQRDLAVRDDTIERLTADLQQLEGRLKETTIEKEAFRETALQVTEVLADALKRQKVARREIEKQLEAVTERQRTLQVAETTVVGAWITTDLSNEINKREREKGPPS